MIFSPETSAAIIEAMNAIELGNNGYADIGTDETVADAVRSAGYTVIRTTNLHGRPVFRGFTAAAQKALAAEPFGVRLTASRPTVEGPDYEAMILTRQENFMMGA